jgi:rRNA maturation endonuclease Nob1
MSALKKLFGYYRCTVCKALSRHQGKDKCEHCGNYQRIKRK